MSKISKNEQELMINTKKFAERLRLGREIDFNEDFRKKYLTREYGNYEKYEKNAIKEEVDPGHDDLGYDTFLRNYHDMMRVTKSYEGEERKEKDQENFEDLLKNPKYADQTIPQRVQGQKLAEDHQDMSKRLQEA